MANYGSYVANKRHIEDAANDYYTFLESTIGMLERAYDEMPEQIRRTGWGIQVNGDYITLGKDGYPEGY